MTHPTLSQTGVESPVSNRVLQVDNLSFQYPQRGLLSGLTAKFMPGVNFVRGGDGRGKSTLLRLLAGELKAQAGQLQADGVRLDAQPEAYRQRVFWMDPRTDAFDQHTAGQCFELLRQRHPTFDPTRLPALIEALSLSEHQHKPLYMLSTGSKRKVWLAAAFAAGTPCVLLDVPFASLDKASIAVVTGLLGNEAQAAARTWVLADYEAPADLPLVTALDLGD